MRTRGCFIILFFLVQVGFVYAQPGADPLRVVIFTPTSENNTYWTQVFKILESAARDLNIKIEHYEFDVRDRFAKFTEGVDILHKIEKPDAAIFSVASDQAKPLLEAIEALNIPTVLLGPLAPAELAELGFSPRNKFKNWIATFSQDEHQKGYVLGKTLLMAARKAEISGESAQLFAAGIGGDLSWIGSELRAAGLAQAVDEFPDVKLLQVVPTHWDPAEATNKTTLLLKRFPTVSVVWAASDQLAMGVSIAFERAGRTLGKTGFTGGLDLSVNGLKQVRAGKMVATVASSLLAYAEILVCLHDYVHGLDFADELGTDVNTEIHLVIAVTAPNHLRLYEKFEAIDFSRFSKVYNPDLIHYDFSFERLEAALNEGASKN